MEQNSSFCKNCQRSVLCTRPPVNHLLHFFISFGTCGLWLFVWLCVSLFRPAWRCSQCGWQQ